MSCLFRYVDNINMSKYNRCKSTTRQHGYDTLNLLKNANIQLFRFREQKHEVDPQANIHMFGHWSGHLQKTNEDTIRVKVVQCFPVVDVDQWTGTGTTLDAAATARYIWPKVIHPRVMDYGLFLPLFVLVIYVSTLLCTRHVLQKLE